MEDDVIKHFRGILFS